MMLGGLSHARTALSATKVVQRNASRSLSTATFHLRESDGAFDRGQVVMETSAGMSVRAMRYESGVAGLEISNKNGKATMLPFQGQQVWDFEMLDRRLTMHSMYNEGPKMVDPHRTWGYIDGYGAFFVHCGANSIGIPQADEHCVHGELPNAKYTSAQLVVGDDAQHGAFVELQGTYDHTIAFTSNWRAQPAARLYADGTTLQLSMRVTNNFHAEMDLMYMAHANFRPVAGSELKYSHKCPSDNLEVSGSVNGLVPPSDEYKAFLKMLEQEPQRHHRFDETFLKNINPEVLVYLSAYFADEEGWAHSMQVLADGSADYIAHKPSQLNTVTRWMVKDPSHAAFGLALPGTAGPTGRESEREKGNVQALEPGNSVLYEVEVGALDAIRAKAVAGQIEKMIH